MKKIIRHIDPYTNKTHTIRPAPGSPSSWINWSAPGSPCSWTTLLLNHPAFGSFSLLLDLPAPDVYIVLFETIQCKIKFIMFAGLLKVPP